MEFAKARTWLRNLKLKPKFQFKNLPPGQTRTFIIPTFFGLAFGVVCFFLLMMAVGFANNVIYFIVFYLITIALTSLWLANENVNRVKITKLDHADLYAGEENPLRLHMNNVKKKSSHSLQLLIRGNRKIQTLPFLAGRSETSLEVPWQPTKRGPQELPRLTLRSFFPFALAQPWSHFSPPESCLVFPEKKGSSVLPQGQRNMDLRESSGLFKDLKLFTATDSMRRIDWRRSQKHQSLLVRTFEEEENQNLHIDLSFCEANLSLEDKISQLALWAYLAEESPFHYSFSFLDFNLPTGRGRAHYLKIMNFLSACPPASEVSP